VNPGVRPLFVRSHRNMIDRKLFVSWIRSTWFGWLLGIPIIIAFALIGEAVHIGGAQVLVGAGMGTGIGLMQVIRRILHKSAMWTCSCIVGLGAPFPIDGRLKGRWLESPILLAVGNSSWRTHCWQLASAHSKCTAPQDWMVDSGKCVRMDAVRGNGGDR